MSGASLEERDLVRRMLAGEDPAFEEFFEAQFPRLYRFALRRMDGDGDASEEVAQAALCRAMGALKSWRAEAALFTWLCTFVLHEIARHHRLSQRQPRPIGLIEDAPDTRGGGDSLAAHVDRGAETETRRLEVGRRVHATLDGLPATYGDVLEWKYILGLSVDEIAARLGVGLKAAESVLTRARQAFRAAFVPPRGETP